MLRFPSSCAAATCGLVGRTSGSVGMAGVVLGGGSGVLGNACRFATTTATTTTPPKTSVDNGNSANRYKRTRVTTENRLTTWCRRLWGLANESGHAAASATIAQAAEALQKLSENAQAAEPLSCGGTGKPDAACAAAAQSNGWIASTDFRAVRPEELIRGLRAIVAADTNRLPAVLVDIIWEVFDAILPPEMQRDLRHTLTTERQDSFYAFIRLLTEMDFDLGAVKKASERLSRVVREYEEALAAMPSAGDGGAPATVAELERHEALTVQVTFAKGAVVSACFKARSAGSALYYTWLRHTAATDGGIRRLMDFRKTVHFFDVECKKHIRALRSQVSKDVAATSQARPATAQEVELALWQQRERDVRVMEASLTFLFHDFFSKEYLIMEELTWFSTPPSMLEQIISAETVHPFTGGLADMRDRLQPTHHRHLFAFLHPAVVEEPLIAVQVALTKGISGSVDEILGRPTPLADPSNTTTHGLAFQRHLSKHGPDTLDKEDVDTAIFYSINSAQSALRGMDMGNMLIKRVVREVEENINASRRARKLTPIAHFSTLSPIPGYTRWLTGEVEKLSHYAEQRARAERRLVEPSQARVFGHCPSALELEERYYRPVREAVLAYCARHATREAKDTLTQLQAAVEKQDLVLANAHALKLLLHQFLKPDKDDPWWMDHAFTKALEQPLLRSVAHYLYKEKKAFNGHILDPVGNFHVSNGATIFRVNYLGNTTEQGSRESGCVMVNYWYNTKTIGDNVTAYERTCAVAVDSFMLRLLSNHSDSP